jgi:hypothetical protein
MPDGLSKDPELRDVEAVRCHVSPLRSPRSCLRWEELTLLNHGTTKTVSKNRTTPQRARIGWQREKRENYHTLERWIRRGRAAGVLGPQRKTDECCQVRRGDDAERAVVLG